MSSSHLLHRHHCSHSCTPPAFGFYHHHHHHHHLLLLLLLLLDPQKSYHHYHHPRLKGSELLKEIKKGMCLLPEKIRRKEEDEKNKSYLSCLRSSPFPGFQCTSDQLKGSSRSTLFF
ncbi:hypothetical protein SLEP1_g10201 [Rubroshorea leprosula]|uniref:Uncharacterized protein n=1 Tax=Rubroshorea leprosula TaxID=152421 RepID=A0AAV5IGL2_9ROSI|nr:hypothetical protein SLEP1_g10201 [Rubroshorea leprosula]